MVKKVLSGADFKKMPWQNGAGTTTELYRMASPGDSEKFLFRLSIAEVHANGPFSLFPGIDRILLLLEGNGFFLQSPNIDVVIREVKVPFNFRGEELIYCTLIDGVSYDFNIMTDRQFATSNVVVEPVKANLEYYFLANYDYKFIYDNEEKKLYRLGFQEDFFIKPKSNTTLIVVDVNLL